MPIRTIVVLSLLAILSPSAAALEPGETESLYADNNRRLELGYTDTGVRFEKHDYKVVKKKKDTWRRVEQPEGDCDAKKPGRVETTFRIVKRHGERVALVETRSFLGCGKGARTVWSAYTRRFSFEPLPADAACKPQNYTFAKGERLLTIKDFCDGTLMVQVQTEDAWIGPLRVSGENKKFKGEEYFLSYPPARHTITLTWARDASAHVNGLIKPDDGKKTRAVGRFKLKTVRPLR